MQKILIKHYSKDLSDRASHQNTEFRNKLPQYIP